MITDRVRLNKEEKMKILVKPLIASALLIVASGVNAQGYSGDKVNDVIYSSDETGDKAVNFKEFYDENVTYNTNSLDVNKDGYISSGEIVIDIKEDLAATIAKMRELGVSEKNIKKTIASELRTADAEAAKILIKMDADGDQLVEPEELLAYQEKQFRKLDRNRDGVISKLDIKKKEKKKYAGWPISQGGN